MTEATMGARPLWSHRALTKLVCHWWPHARTVVMGHAEAKQQSLLSYTDR